jgi:coenzyme PQQ synthesis protein D (PqqD)
MSRFVVRGAKLAARKVGHEMVILAAEDSSLFVLNEVGTTIWDAVDGRTPIEVIAETICVEYDVDPETARRDVEQFVEALAGAGLLSTSDEAIL